MLLFFIISSRIGPHIPNTSPSRLFRSVADRPAEVHTAFIAEIIFCCVPTSETENIQHTTRYTEMSATQGSETFGGNEAGQCAP
jgi:hypothetical protein